MVHQIWRRRKKSYANADNLGLDGLTKQVWSRSSIEVYLWSGYNFEVSKSFSVSWKLIWSPLMNKLWRIATGMLSGNGRAATTKRKY